MVIVKLNYHDPNNCQFLSDIQDKMMKVLANHKVYNLKLQTVDDS